MSQGSTFRSRVHWTWRRSRQWTLSCTCTRVADTAFQALHCPSSWGRGARPRLLQVSTHPFLLPQFVYRSSMEKNWRQAPFAISDCLTVQWDDDDDDVVVVVVVVKNRKRKSCSCHNDGRCDAFGRCQCRAGYYGARCELDSLSGRRRAVSCRRHS